MQDHLKMYILVLLCFFQVQLFALLSSYIGFFFLYITHIFGAFLTFYI
jgi:hypothetical protein